MANSAFYIGEKNFPLSIATDHDLSGVVTPFVSIERPTISLAVALADDGGIFANYTNKLSVAVVDDIAFLPADVVAVDDAFYFATITRVSSFLVGMGQLGIGTWVTVLEYWNGTAWASLASVVDGTVGFTVGDDIDGVKISFTIPTDWERTLVNSIGPFYFVRARVTTGDPSPVQQPLGSFVRIGKDVFTGSIVGTGVGGVFTIQIPQGLFDEPGQYTLQSRIEKSGDEVQKGDVSEFEVKKEHAH